MPVSASSAVVTVFESIEQIRELTGFREDNPLTTESYHSLVGYYTFKERVYCCVEKANGQLCKHEHGKGWLVRKTDGSVTLIGRNCANDKFGADSTVFKDIHLAENTLRRQGRLTKILNHLAQRAQREATLKSMRQQLEDLGTRISMFLEGGGIKTAKRLLDMARRRNGDVLVTGVNYRESTKNGVTQRERSSISHRLGNLKGLDVLSRDSYTPLYVAIGNIQAAFSAAADLGEKPSKGVIDDLAGRLDRYDHIVREIEALVQMEALFMANSMLLLCFLVDDRAERPKCARMAMHQADIAGGKDHAKNWLADQESQLASQLGMQKIEIA